MQGALLCKQPRLGRVLVEIAVRANGFCVHQWVDSGLLQLNEATRHQPDGYGGLVEDRGAFDLFTPDDDVFASTTDLLRSAGAFLYWRRLYETMAVWEANAALARYTN